MAKVAEDYFYISSDSSDINTCGKLGIDLYVYIAYLFIAECLFVRIDGLKKFSAFIAYIHNKITHIHVY